jgi:hypothetical protein
MRVADAQTGRPYSNHYRGWKFYDELYYIISLHIK